MNTKFYHRFLNRSAHFEADIELVDVFKLAVSRATLHSPGATFMFDDIAEVQHPRLANRPNSSAGRYAAVAHLRATLSAAFIKDIYEDAILYFSEVLEAAAKRGLDPARLVGEHQTPFKANDLLSAGSWDNVVRLVSNSIFRALENEKNTRKLLEKLDVKLNLGIDPSKILAAMPYFEMRHLLVHANGIADQAFCKAYPDHNEVIGRKIKLPIDRIRQAKTAIVELIEEFDRKLIQNGLVGLADCQP